MPTKKVLDDDDEPLKGKDVDPDANEKPIDETIPGGRYKVNDQIVNAEGEPIKESKK